MNEYTRETYGIAKVFDTEGNPIEVSEVMGAKYAKALANSIRTVSDSWKGTPSLVAFERLMKREGRNRLRVAIRSILRQAQIDFIMKELDSVQSHSNQSDSSR